MTEDEQAQLDYDKIIGQYRLKIIDMTQPLRLYGQGQFVDQLISELVNLLEQAFERLGGVDRPYITRPIHW